MNLQQLDSRLTAVESKLGQTEQEEAAFIKNTVAPFDARLTAIETAIADIQSQLKAIKGA